MITIATIIGARPQFIKAATINRIVATEPGIKEIIIHTGQHYDSNMSDIFFNELNIPQPDFNLDVGSGTHAQQTARILERLEPILIDKKPDCVLVYGDTNSTLAGALVAAKLSIKVIHVEAGLRSYNRQMPEEINRIATDHISDLLFAPTQNALDILQNEGFKEISVLSGDVMYDSLLYLLKLSQQKESLEKITGLEDFYLGTIHRQENTNNPQRLQNIFSAFSQLDHPIIVPLHPRTRKLLKGINFNKNVRIIDSIGPLKMIRLIENCRKVLTDSGGLQKEAFLLKKPCITLRDETEWIETLNHNWNFITGTDVKLILEKVANQEFGPHNKYFGDGQAANKIIDTIKDWL
jgi:UDP-GlcNAc3NAcA epimerase